MEKNETLNRFPAMLNLLKHPVVHFNKEGIVQFVNEIACRFLGYEASEIIGKNIREFVFSNFKSSPELFKYFFTDKSLVNCNLIPRPGMSMDYIGKYIAYKTANLHSVNCQAGIREMDDGFVATFEPRIHRIPDTLIDPGLGYMVLIDAEDRIVSYSNNFFDLYYTDSSLDNLPVEQCFEEGEWARVQKRLAQSREELVKYAADNVEPWTQPFGRLLDGKETGSWTFAPSGEWQIRGNTLCGNTLVAKGGWTWAMLKERIPSVNDIRVEFKVRCPQGAGFQAVLCGHQTYIDGSGYLMGLFASTPMEWPNNLCIRKDNFNRLLLNYTSPPLDQWNTIVAERNGGRISLSIQGRVVAEYYDMDPVLDPSQEKVILCTNGYSEFRDLRISIRPSRLMVNRLMLNKMDVNLRVNPGFNCEMSMSDDYCQGVAVRVLRFTDVTRQRRLEKALLKSEQTQARLNSENENLKKKLEEKSRGLVGDSPVMRKLGLLISTLAETDTPILITGETGTGKDLAANAVHSQSRRSARPFIKVDCASLPSTLLEAELFGYEKGAFTGANERKIGRFEAAGEGTVFIDEIGNLEIALQAKLLRVLQDREFERLGGTQPIPVRARFISATNANLAERMRNGQFREDLYYRINGITLEMPSLRSHPEDIPLLFSHFLQESCLANNKPVPKVSAAALEIILRYGWPGNVRELKHTTDYVAVLGKQDSVEPSDLPATIRDTGKTASGALAGKPARVSPSKLSKVQLKAAIRKCSGNMSETAVTLGICRGSLYKLMKRFGIG